MEGRSVLDLPMPAVYVQHLAREIRDPGALCVGTGMRSADLNGPAARISVHDNLRCVRNAANAAESPDWYQEWGTRIAEHFHGPLTPAWLSAPTLGDGLDLFVRYFPARIPYMAIQARETDGDYILQMRPLLEVGELLPLLVEVPLLILEQYIATIRNSRGQEARTELGYRAPGHSRSYQRWFQSSVEFDCARNALVMPAAWCKTPNLGYDETAWRSAVAKCGFADELQSPRRIVNHLRSAFWQAFDPGSTASMPTLESMAAELNMSPRTLIRRLRGIGTTFYDQRDEVRKLRARELLEVGTLSVSGIAEILQFSDPPNFGRAFKRWFGVSPSEYRTAMAAAPADGPLPD